MEPSVVVIGGGIAGIQASLDLANSGHKVYLIEKTPSIGGKMALLDKTFPTMDCAICIFAPKMIEASRHPNINILTYSQVKAVTGEAGNFNVKVLRNSRYVSEEKCTGCDDCTEVCTVTIPMEYEMEIGQRKAIYRPFPQAVPNVFTIDKRGVPPCRATCPAGMNVQGYVALIKEGKFKEALELMRSDIPFPSVCGRVCFHPCESECERKNLDTSIAIKYLKRFAADYEALNGVEPVEPAPINFDEKVAVIGSGPAGLTAAHDLKLKGYPVTVFESMPELGGMLRYGIPSYRLPKQVLDLEIKRITDLGVEVKKNSTFGKDFTVDDLHRDGYSSVLVAVGVQKSRLLNIEGEKIDGVVQALDLLVDINKGAEVQLSGKIAVIGGGNVAIDAARSSLRLGPEEVNILYRRTQSEMPAYAEDVERAIKEGVKFHFLVNPVRFIGENGKVTTVECVNMELGEPDESGRRRPIPIDGSEFMMDIDLAILAVGQVPDIESVPKNVEVTKSSTIIVDSITKETSCSGVFACGDIVLGPATVIEAIAEGKEAAESIHRYLRGYDLKKGRGGPIEKVEHVSMDGFHDEPRQPMPELDVDEIKGDFQEIELGFTEEMAIKEAERCLSCGGCSECLECEKVCEPEAINHLMTDETLDLNVESIIVATGLEPFDPSVLKEFGYRRFKNVITALEFERMVTATGPTEGELIRPSDHEHPHDVTFIQCVGSRDLKEGYPYCSAVCCMHTTKEGMLVKEHAEGSEVSIFYTDIRAFGKKFREFVDRAKSEYSINYVRAKPSEIREEPDSGSLHFWYEDTLSGEVKEKTTDLLVLCTALVPSPGNAQLAKTLGIEVDEYGFFVQPNPIRAPVSTTREGIYVCGYSQGPKDIPDTIAEASATAAMVALTTTTNPEEDN